MVEINEIVRKVVGELHSGSNPETANINKKDNVLRVAVGSDHGGFEAKEILKQYLKTLGYRVTDVGTDSMDSVDYPDFAVKVAKKVASGDCERGIMIDGAGIGSSIVCNKVRGIRAALCYNMKTITNSREHNMAGNPFRRRPALEPDQQDDGCRKDHLIWIKKN